MQKAEHINALTKNLNKLNTSFINMEDKLIELKDNRNQDTEVCLNEIAAELSNSLREFHMIIIKFIKLGVRVDGGEDGSIASRSSQY